MPKEVSVSFKDFSVGEFGSIGLFHAPPGSFHGADMLRAPQGYIYPRPGTKSYPTTGLPNGVSVGLGWTGVPGRDLWTIIGNTVYQRDSSSFAAAWVGVSGTLSVTPNELVSWVEATAGIVYLLVPNDGLYRLDLATGAPGTLTKIAAVTSAMAGRAIAIWGNRLMIGGWSPGYRVYYSEANDFSTWPAGNYFDVGAAPQVRFLGQQRQHLAIALQSGEWWVMNGSTPATGTLRQIVHPQGTWHFWGNMATVIPNDQLYLVPNQGTWPAVFDGVDVQEYRHLGFSGPAGNVAGEQNVVPLHLRNEVGFICAKPGERGQGMLFIDGTWQYVTIGGNIASGVATDGQGMVFLHDGGGASAKDQVYRLNVKTEGGLADQPGGAKSGTARGDADSSTPVNAWFELPGWFDEEGYEWMVRQVVVHIRKFNIGGGVNNEVQMVVDAHQHEESGLVSSATYSWTEPTTSGTSGGTRDRIVFNVGDQGNGQGFQLRFPKIVGVGVVEVVAKLERTSDQPRS